MSSSKPEELVARLYEEGLSDDEVKAQLADFGLSGREIHVLIKKARDLKGGGGKTASGKGEERSQPAATSSPFEEIRTAKTEEWGSRKSEASGMDSLEYLMRDTGAGSGAEFQPREIKELPVVTQSKTTETKSDGEYSRKKKEKPEGEGKKPLLSGLFGKKNKEPKEAGEGKQKPLESYTPSAPPEIAKPAEVPKKSKFSLFGKKGEKSESKPKEEPKPKEFKSTEEAVGPQDNQRLGMLKGLIGGSKDQTQPSQVQEATLTVTTQKPSGSEQKTPQTGQPSQPEVKEEKKGKFSLFGKKKDEKPEDKKDKSMPKVKEDKKGDKKGASGESYQMTMKRLSMIKESISKPITVTPVVSVSELPKEEIKPKEEPGGEISERESVIGKQKEPSEKEITLTSEEEEKMDAEIAKKLTDGIGNLEVEMGEIKQLLETLRELNIKLIEILESK